MTIQSSGLQQASGDDENKRYFYVSERAAVRNCMDKDAIWSRQDSF